MRHLGGSMKLPGEAGRGRALGHPDGPCRLRGAGLGRQPPQEGGPPSDPVPTPRSASAEPCGHDETKLCDGVQHAGGPLLLPAEQGHSA